jgi:hypothetical protein
MERMVMAQPNPELVAFNQRNKTFWDLQKTLMDQRMADAAVLKSAIEMVACEARRQVPVRNQMSFEKALEHAAETKRRFAAQLARSGGNTTKSDPLQNVIIGIVRQNSVISCAKLLKELRSREGDGIIEEIDETTIYFRKPAMPGVTGKKIEKTSVSMASPISRLKHRLTRAKKKIERERGSR